MDSFLDYAESYKKNQLVVWIDISTRCNAGCPQCHRTNPNGCGTVSWLPMIQWSLAQFKKAYPYSVLKHIHRFEICGTWGDPIMNKDIFQICEYILQNSYATILLNTNGSLRDEDWWFRFGYLGGKRIETWFAVEGINQEMHELYRQNTNLEKVLDNMESYSAYGRTSVFVVVFKHNEEHLLDIQKMTYDRGATDILFFPSNRWRNQVGNSKQSSKLEKRFNFKNKNDKELYLEQIINLENPLYRDKDYYKWSNNLANAPEVTHSREQRTWWSSEIDKDKKYEPSN